MPSGKFHRYLTSSLFLYESLISLKAMHKTLINQETNCDKNSTFTEIKLHERMSFLVIRKFDWVYSKFLILETEMPHIGILKSN